MENIIYVAFYNRETEYKTIAFDAPIPEGWKVWSSGDGRREIYRRVHNLSSVGIVKTNLTAEELNKQDVVAREDYFEFSDDPEKLGLRAEKIDPEDPESEVLYYDETGRSVDLAEYTVQRGWATGCESVEFCYEWEPWDGEKKPSGARLRKESPRFTSVYVSGDYYNTMISKDSYQEYKEHISTKKRVEKGKEPGYRDYHVELYEEDGGYNVSYYAWYPYVLVAEDDDAGDIIRERGGVGNDFSELGWDTFDEFEEI